MTTFITEDIESLKTDWFTADINPVHEGEYEVISSKWPWPHRAEWTEKSGWRSAVCIEKWRGLKEKFE